MFVVKKLLNVVLVWAAVLPLVWGGSVQAEGESVLRERVRNETLRLPNRTPIAGYGLVNAFPGVTFDHPVALAFPPEETNRLFVVERSGAIYVITNLARPDKTRFLDLSSQVDLGGGEGGLLSLAFHPGFATNGFFFVFRTKYASTPGLRNRLHDVVSRFEVSSVDPNMALTSSEVTILAQADDSDQHNGGDLKFGPDGYLYVSIGERVYRDIDWPDQTPVDRDLQGAILRIDVDGRTGNLPPNPHPASTDRYWIPTDNPFVGVIEHHGFPVAPSQARTELYATGFRNPWRMAFDPVTGDLYAADVGGNRKEEIDLVVAGADYGWPYLEGFLPNGYSPPSQFTPRPPLHTYEHGWSGTNGNCVIGGVVYRGSAMPWLQGRYLFADFFSGHLWALQRQGGTSAVERLVGATIGLTAFGTDPRDGEVLLTHLFDGTILRLVYVPPEEATNLPPTLADTGIFADLATLTPNPGIVPYEINLAFWSDHAIKTRWFSLPETNMTIGFNSTGAWTFPTGAVWVKHFELELTNGQPASARRLETRVLVNAADGFYGLTYRWGDSTTNAWLVPEPGLDEHFSIRDANGTVVREQDWRYPSRSECMNCHTKWGGRALGFNTAQLNRAGPGALQPTNQLLALGAAGYLHPMPPDPAELPALATPDDPSAPLEFRVRSYFQANCSMCHTPGAHGWVAWDARLSTPLADAGIVSDGGVIKPGSLQESRLYYRLLGFPQLMPPIGTSVYNSNAIDLVSNWITNLPPAPWSHESIGGVIHYGGSTLSNGLYRIDGTGISLQGTNDSFQFMHRPFVEPAAQFVARLVSQSTASDQAIAGLMVRAGSGTSDRFILTAFRPDGTGLTLWRTAPNDVALSEPSGQVSLPQWFRLVRLGDDITVFRSDDGTNWIEPHTMQWEAAGPLKVGFAVNSGSLTAFNNATFDSASYLSIALTSSVPTPIRQPAHVPLQANVERSGRELARVDFYDGAQKIGEAMSAPYAMTASNVWTGDHEFTAHAVDETGTEIVSQPLRLVVQPPPAVAALLSEERVHGGSWSEHYGTEGHVIVNHQTNLPAFTSLTGATAETWADNTQDTRALTKLETESRIAAAWKAPDSFTVLLTIRDGQLHRLSLYFLDWDTTDGRIQRVEFLDPATGGLLSSHTLSNFSGGVYLAAMIRGSLEVRVTALGGADAVLSGMFLDEAFETAPAVELLSPFEGQTIDLPSSLTMKVNVSPPDAAIQFVEYYLDDEPAGLAEQSPFEVTFTNVWEGTHVALAMVYDNLGNHGVSLPVIFHAELPRPKAVFLREDDTTRGSWPEQYGTQGFLLPPLTNWWPTRLPYEICGASTWIQEIGLNPDYLELPDQDARAYSFLYSESDIICDLNLADGRPASVALYFFDESVYPQTMEVVDPGTGQVLDSRTVTNGFGGRYLVWMVQGHVRLRVSNPAGGTQARVNGLFLDPFTHAPPEVSLVQPGNDLEVSTPAKILLVALATEPENLRRVEFRTATAKLGEALQTPYEFLWEYPVAGTHQVFARAVGLAGAAGDSRQATVRVDFAAPSKVRFVRSDADTGGSWRGLYGAGGYWLPSTLGYSSLPTTISLTCTQSWIDFGYSEDSRALSRPEDITRILSFWMGDNLWQFQMRLNDGRAHRISLYNYAPGWTNRISLSILDADSAMALDAREIASQDTGTYLTWDVQGDVVVRVTAPDSTAFLNGIFIDPNPDAYDEWQKRRFKPVEQANVAISGPAADPDGDAYDNWTEYLLGRNPAAPDSQPPFWLTREAGEVILHVLVAKIAGDDVVQIESSLDLQTWTDAAAVPLMEARDQGDKVERLYQMRPANEQALFFRLRFQPPW